MGVDAWKHCRCFETKWEYQGEMILGTEARKGLRISDKLSNFTGNPKKS
jgi:hypothetical protein